MVVRVLQGHVVDVLNGLEPEQFHVSVCSPPYWLLRSYGTPPQIWPNPDGTPPCCGGIDLQTGAAIDGHEWGNSTSRRIGRGDVDRAIGGHGGTYPDTGGPIRAEASAGTICARCGCWRGELGSEPTVERYVADLVYVFRSVRRVLRKDGTCWVNLAGSYFNNPGGQNGGSVQLSNGTGTSTQGGRTKLLQQARISVKAMEANRQTGRQDRTGGMPRDYWLKPLDFVDVPGLFAHAMQQDGWWWRADIALVKRSPLPESVSGWKWERCKVKTQRRISVAEHEMRGNKVPATWDVGEHTHDSGVDMKGRYDQDRETMADWQDCPGCPKCAPNDGLILRRGNGRPTRAWERLLVFAKAPGAFWDSDAVREPHAGYEYTGHSGVNQSEYEPPTKDGQARSSFKMANHEYHPAGRNMRNWQFWPTAGGGLGEAHYASFNIGIPSLAIRAGTSEGGVCAKCGAPLARVMERVKHPTRDMEAQRAASAASPGRADGHVCGPEGMVDETRTVAWRPTCPCKDTSLPIPATVLDPFVGTGTTLLAANQLGRDGIGVDLKSEYLSITEKRLSRVPIAMPLFGPTSTTASVESDDDAAAGG